MTDKKKATRAGAKAVDRTEAINFPDKNIYRHAQFMMRRPALAAGLFSALINILMLTGSLYMLQVYDRVLSSGSVATLQGLFVIVTLAYVFYGIYEFLRARILSRAAMRLYSEVAPEAFRAWLRSGIAGERSAGLPLRDLEILRGFLSSPAVGSVFDLPWMPLYLAVLFLIHPLLGWLTLGGAGVVIAVALVNHWLTKGTTDLTMAGDARARDFAERGMRQAELVDAMGMQANVGSHWLNLQNASLAVGQAGSDKTEATSAFSKAFRMFLQSAILTLGAFLVLRHEMSAGMIIAASILSGRALSPVDQIIGQWKAIARAAVAHRRLRDFFDTQRSEAGRVQLPAPTGQITATGLLRLGEAVMAGERRRVLKGISFDLNPGEALGVIGNSASGKSSLARLLVGVWQPDAGEIRMDGATRTQWNSADLGRHIGYLPQSVEMLPGSVRDNITRFSPLAKDADLIEAASMAGVHEMILALPLGYSTMLGSPDQPLSGGQIQRLGLARAIFGKPRIVVLDEPNASLDASGEEALLNAIRELKAGGTTVIVMTHRPNALSVMDKVMVLNAGEMIKYGRIDEVVKEAPAAAAATQFPPRRATPNARARLQPGVSVAWGHDSPKAAYANDGVVDDSSAAAVLRRRFLELKNRSAVSGAAAAEGTA